MQCFLSHEDTAVVVQEERRGWDTQTGREKNKSETQRLTEKERETDTDRQRNRDANGQAGREKWTGRQRKKITRQNKQRQPGHVSFCLFLQITDAVAYSAVNCWNPTVPGSSAGVKTVTSAMKQLTQRSSSLVLSHTPTVKSKSKTCSSEKPHLWFKPKCVVFEGDVGSERHLRVNKLVLRLGQGALQTQCVFLKRA